VAIEHDVWLFVAIEDDVWLFVAIEDDVWLFVAMMCGYLWLLYTFTHSS